MKSCGKVWLAVPLCVFTLALILAAPLQAAAQQFVYTANFGDGTISGFSVNPVNGKLTEVPGSPFGAGVGPAPITHSPDGHFLYVALLNQFLGGPCGTNFAELISYSIEPHTGALTLINDVTLPDFCPTDVITDPSGEFVYVASIHFDDTKFGEIAGFKTSAGNLTALPGSPFASPIQVTPGQNPAIGSLAMSQDGKVVYASDPNDAAGILIFDRDRKSGALAFRNAFNSGTAFGPIAITPSGKFLLAMPPLFPGNGGNGIYAYEIGPHGDLTPVPGSPSVGPGTDFANALRVSPNGDFVAFAGVGGVGVLRETSSHRRISLSSVPGSPFGGGLPAALTFDHSGRFVYVPGTVFKINPVTGVLTKVSDFTTGSAAEGITAVQPCQFRHEDRDDKHDAGRKRDGDDRHDADDRRAECRGEDGNQKRD